MPLSFSNDFRDRPPGGGGGASAISSRQGWWVAAPLLVLFWWLAISASAEKSHTSDELPHITAGYVFNRFGDFRMHPENGVLPQRLFGLVPLALDARLPMDRELWAQSVYWQLGWNFFYQEGNPTNRIIQGARALNALFGVALGALLFALTRRLHGTAGALLALGFFVLAPNFLAHAGLATSDLAAALFLTLAPWTFWRHLQRRDVGSGALAAMVSGLTLAAKFNGLLLAPIYLALALADAAKPAAAVRGRRWSRLAGNVLLAAGQALAAAAIIWAFFNFRFSPRGPEAPEFLKFAGDWTRLTSAIGWKGAVLEWMRTWHVMPEAWLYGLADVLAGEVMRPAFFAGEHSMRGWWQFFPTLFLVKTPLALLAALLLAAIAGFAKVRRENSGQRADAWHRACPFVITALVIAAVALRSNLNIGDRHILALYPPLLIGLGVLASQRWSRVAGVALLAGAAIESFAIRPHYLASFNVLSGGPEKAHRLVVDSSLDWGQDLPALRDEIARQRGQDEPFYLGYFGSAWPPHYGVRPNYFLPSTTYIVRPPLEPYELEPGWYAISATILSEVYSRYRGPWTAEFETEYRRLQAELRTGEAAKARAAFAEFDRLRLSRLCKYLQRQRPDAIAGYSIPLFRLDAAELAEALEGPVVSTHRVRPP